MSCNDSLGLVTANPEACLVHIPHVPVLYSQLFTDLLKLPEVV